MEACDDGNVNAGDGCARLCTFEPKPTETLPASILDLPLSFPTVASLSQPMSVFSQPQPVLHEAPAPAVPGTGPESLAVMAGGAAAGWAWIRRRRMR
jgi:hypothetical protein